MFTLEEVTGSSLKLFYNCCLSALCLTLCVMLNVMSRRGVCLFVDEFRHRKDIVS